ncbi:T-lymphocyte surface antigen Ly-9 [Microtus ochrogaster]|uniref:T-lymphocyte surface antigen Ly-9 n=1 Tax=Microtus ochrogaster TaxID=79684 RepID=A0A8J6KK11_MICOH|nr:T-lymphocyte surface antigen Ly-9 [Microtus ochrogaster]
MPTKTTRPKPASDSSSDNSAATEDDEEMIKMHNTVDGRNQGYGLVTQEDTAHELTSEYELVTLDDTVVMSEV